MNGGSILILAAAIGLGIWALAIVNDDELVDETFGDFPDLPDEMRWPPKEAVGGRPSNSGHRYAQDIRTHVGTGV